MRQVVDLARLYGWAIYHTHDSRRSVAGFPDLVLVRERVMFVELKTDAGKTSPAQNLWLGVLTAAGATAFLWRPKDWPTIERTLAPPPAAGTPPR